jgi:hypothetical protein
LVEAGGIVAAASWAAALMASPSVAVSATAVNFMVLIIFIDLVVLIRQTI